MRFISLQSNFIAEVKALFAGGLWTPWVIEPHRIIVL